jgi:hypothetical protein
VNFPRALLAFILIAPSCSIRDKEVRVNIIYAAIELNGASVSRVVVTSTVSDLRNIARKSIPARIVVFDCSSGSNRYPIFPMLETIRMSDINSLRRRLEVSDVNERVNVHGDIPLSVLRRISEPCVKWEGGSYYGDRLVSNVVVL